MVNNAQIAQAVNIIKKGGIIAYPTEAVFGLGCDPDNEAALTRLLALKQRPMEKGLILVAANWQQLEPYLQALNDQQLQTILSTWPGPVTWIIPAKAEVSPLVRGVHSSLAVRISAHPIVHMLCEALGKPLISTSANRSTEAPCMNAQQITEVFQSEVDLIVSGELGALDKPTTIRDLLTGNIIR